MKKNAIKNAVRLLIIAIQIIILIPPIVLQYLSHKKMGVVRYLVYKKRMFSLGMFSPNLMQLYKVSLFIIILLSVLAIVYLFVKRVYFSSMRDLIFAVILACISEVCMASKSFESMSAYHYFLIAMFIIIILQYLKLFFIKAKKL